MNRIKEVLRYHYFLEQTGLTQKINGLLFYLRKIPFLGKKVPNKVFHSYDFKHVLFILLGITGFISQFFMKFVWLVAYLFIGKFMNLDGASHSLWGTHTLWKGLLLWLILVVLVKGSLEHIFASADTQIVHFADYFQLSKSRLIRSDLFLTIGKNLFFYLPAFCVTGFLLKKPFQITLGLFLLYGGFYLFFSWLSRKIYQNPAKRILWRIGLFILLGLLIAALLVSSLFYDRNWMPFLFIWPSLFFLVVWLVLTSYLILHFSEERGYVDSLIYENAAALQNIKEVKDNQYLSLGKKMQGKMERTVSEKFTHLKGSEFLNALLFERYRKVLGKALRIRLIIIHTCGILSVIAALWIRQSSLKPIEINELYVVVPIFFFICYLISLGKNIVQIVFISCDVSMLYFPFYREAKTILSGFMYRFKRTLIYNSLLIGSLAFYFLLFSLLTAEDFDSGYFIVTFLCFISFNLLFSFHELFIYYLLQPFSGDMEVVNPVYKLVSGLFYWLSWMNTQLTSLAGLSYALILLGISLLYVGIGFVVINKKAPAAFRIK